MIDFPHHVAGWLSEAEGHALAVYARGRDVLEIGAYCGRSTLCMAQTAKSVTAVDPFDGRGTPQPRDTYEEFLANVRDSGFANTVITRRGTIDEVGPTLTPDYDLVFIDGAHDYVSVRNDTEWALKLLKPGGLIAYHDFRNGTDPGVDLAVQDLLDDGGEVLLTAGSLALVRPPRELVTGKFEKPRIVMAMPHRGWQKSGRSFWREATRRDVDILDMDMSSSTLELNFNRMWCEALNARRIGFTHFVMLHDDVCPEAGWMDVLWDEIHTHDADVVSAIVPLKSIHGLTSTALGHAPPDSIWRPLRRLTMAEVCTGTPETFSREDILLDGPPTLFINTGCWIADLRKPWVERNVFRNVSRNVCVGGRWKADCMSEDWAFSCDLQRWGAKVLATRKVKLYHERPEFHNQAAWGAWQRDEEYFQRTELAPALAPALQVA